MTAGTWTSSHLGLTQSPSYTQIPLSNCETDLVYIMTACNQELNRALLSPDIQVSEEVFPSMQEPSCAKRQADLHQLPRFHQAVQINSVWYAFERLFFRLHCRCKTYPTLVKTQQTFLKQREKLETWVCVVSVPCLDHEC